MTGMYRKKPVVVKAIAFDGTDEGVKRVRDFYPDKVFMEILLRNNVSYNLVIHTLEGDMLATAGDYIIRGVAGEVYPCKPDIFHATYEAVEESEGFTLP